MATIYIPIPSPRSISTYWWWIPINLHFFIDPWDILTPVHPQFMFWFHMPFSLIIERKNTLMVNLDCIPIQIPFYIPSMFPFTYHDLSWYPTQVAGLLILYPMISQEPPYIIYVMLYPVYVPLYPIIYIYTYIHMYIYIYIPWYSSILVSPMICRFHTSQSSLFGKKMWVKQGWKHEWKPSIWEW